MTTRPAEMPIAEYLERSGRHPVIVIGAVMAGKSMLLMSLLEALGRSTTANVYLGDPILPRSDPRSAEAHRLALHYYEDQSRCMAEGRVAPATQLAQPLFIPVDIETRNDRRVVKLALLEGRGEWYHPMPQGSGTMFPEFRPDLASVLEQHPSGLSVIWVAPCCGDPELRHESDFALVGALAEYRRRRGPRYLDSHLFLLSKWDSFSPPLQGMSLGARPFEVAEVLANCFPNAWPRYRALALGPGRRAFMHYSAGLIVEARVRQPPIHLRDTFDRFPRIVLNWLYGNATETDSGGDGQRTRRLLFSDVLPRRARPAPLLERLSIVSRDVGFYRGIAWGIVGTLLFLPILIIFLGLFG